MAKPVGILGGTFDPVHYGHLRVATEIYHSCDLAEVRLVPLHTPPHRQLPSALPEQRLQMLQLAIEDYKGLLVDERELQRGDVSFTVDTLRSVREEIGSQSLCLIMGIDTFQTLNSWHQWSSLIEYAHIIIVARPGTQTELTQIQVSELYNKNLTRELLELHAHAAGKIFNANIAEIDISSTQARESLRLNKDVHALIPANVVSYIKKEDLYHKH